MLTWWQSESHMLKQISRPSILSVWLYIDSVKRERKEKVRQNEGYFTAHYNGDQDKRVMMRIAFMLTYISIFSNEPPR